MQSVETIVSVIAFLWGAIWGSFLNVVIYRLPRGMSLLTPASHCPFCKEKIRWYDNIPIISYIILKGRCRYCKAGISVQYPIVELTTALISLACWKVVAFNPYIPSLAMALVSFLFLFIFCAAIVAISFIDTHHYIIPNKITFPLMLVGILFSLSVGRFFEVTVVESLVGILVGGGVLAGLIELYKVIRKKVGMGWGDVKLVAMIGAFWGYKSILFVLLAGSLQGILFALFALLIYWRGKKGFREFMSGTVLPFGPFLGLAALEWAFFKPYITSWLPAWLG